MPYAKLDNPQSLNLYSYVYNNPLGRADADGHLPAVLVEAGEDVAKATTAVIDLPVVAAVAAGAYVINQLVNPSVVSAGDKTPQELQQQAQEEQKEAPPEPQAASDGAKKGNGRGGKQARLREIGNDDKASSADRGWIASEQNQISNGNRSSIRVPPGKNLAHRRGQEARKGYDYTHSDLQDEVTHKTQHRVEKVKKKDNQ